MATKCALDAAYLTLASEARELYLDRVIPEIDSVPDAVEFYRRFVSSNKPVVIQNCIQHWPALKKWNSDYFRKMIGNVSVTVAVTPNGYADAIADGKFVMPEERQMKFSNFLDILERPSLTNGIFYVQKQNSNFTDEFSALADDVELQMDWAHSVFGRSPDAVNFWMGDGRAVTSMHKDHYENLYCVVSGEKTFTLIPPTDQPFVPYELYQPAVYKENTEGVFEIIDDLSQTEPVPWIAIDPCAPDLSRYPQFENARPVSVTVRAGEVLYLPSLWYHHVRQSHGCIAVNFWYDMEYDIKYAYYKFVEDLLRHSDRQLPRL